VDTKCTSLVTDLTGIGVVVVNPGAGIISQFGDICVDSYATLWAGTGTNYLWNTGETTRNIIAEPLEYYTVTYLISNGCTVQASIEVAPCQNDCTHPNQHCYVRKRTDPPAEFNTFGVFPSPADDEVQVQIEEPASLKLQISMISQFGNIVRNAAIEKGDKKAVLYVNDVSEGVYVITAQAENGYIIRQKVVVLHRK
jgi:hypothetical protein